jgi:hypothetical protein
MMICVYLAQKLVCYRSYERIIIGDFEKWDFFTPVLNFWQILFPSSRNWSTKDIVYAFILIFFFELEKLFLGNLQGFRLLRSISTQFIVCPSTKMASNNKGKALRAVSRKCLRFPLFGSRRKG